MAEFEELRKAVEDLVDAQRLQAKEIERIVTHLEQQTVPLDPPTEIPVVVSELSELHLRVKRLGS